MEKTNGNGSLSSAVDIPTIIVTDYDADLARLLQEPTKQKINSENTQSVPTNNRLVKSRSTTLNESGEGVDKEIINSLKNAHLVNVNIKVDVKDVITSKNENPSMIKDLADNSETHVEVDAATTSTPTTSGKTEQTEENVKLLTELPKVETIENLNERSESATDDDLADMEVSNITSRLEARHAFVPLHVLPPLSPLPPSILCLKNATKIVPMMVPSSKLPDISDIVNPPQCVPVKKQNPLFDTPESRRLPDSNAIPPFNRVEGSRFDRSECIPKNGGNEFRKSRRLHGESESSVSSSSDKHSESSDDQPPVFWKIRDSSCSTDKSDGDDSVPPTASNNEDSVPPTESNNADSVPPTASNNEDSIPPTESNNEDIIPPTVSNNEEEDSVPPTASNNADSVPSTASNNETKSSSSTKKLVDNDEEKK